MSFGVNVNPAENVPVAPGMVPGVEKANVPAMDPAPPESVEADNGWPKVMALAVGAVVMVGVALLTVMSMEPLAVL